MKRVASNLAETKTLEVEERLAEELEDEGGAQSWEQRLLVIALHNQVLVAKTVEGKPKASSSDWIGSTSRPCMCSVGVGGVLIVLVLLLLF